MYECDAAVGLLGAARRVAMAAAWARHVGASRSPRAPREAPSMHNDEFACREGKRARPWPIALLRVPPPSGPDVPLAVSASGFVLVQ